MTNFPVVLVVFKEITILFLDYFSILASQVNQQIFLMLHYPCIRLMTNNICQKNFLGEVYVGHLTFKIFPGIATLYLNSGTSVYLSGLVNCQMSDGDSN